MDTLPEEDLTIDFEEEIIASDSGKSWRISVSADKNFAYLDLDPAGEVPKPEEVRSTALNLGVDEQDLFQVEKIEQILQNTVNSQIPLTKYPLFEDEDGYFSVDISDDEIRATLTMHKESGQGTALSLKEVGAAIRSSGLKNLNFERIKTDILQFFREDSIELKDYLLVEGTPPQAGQDRELTWDVDFIADDKAAELKKGFDFAPEDAFEGIKSIEKYPVEIVKSIGFVKTQSVIASVTKFDGGKPGSNVYGNPIEGIPGKQVKLKILENVKFEREVYMAQIDGIFETWIEDETYFLRVRPHRNARVDVKVAKDLLTAFVDLDPGEGTGIRLNEETIKEKLVESGVIRGIDMEAVGRAVRQAERVGMIKDVPVAYGQPVENPDEGRINLKVAMATGRSVTIKEDGSADFKNQDQFTLVQKDQLIAEITAPGEKPEDGWDVYGKDLIAREGSMPSLEIGKNIRQETDENKNLKLFAAKAGELVYDNNLIDVQTVYTVAGDVGLETGNIRFSGSVNVAGTVKPNHFVIASGTVKIAGSIDGALVSAEESIHIQQGIIGAGKATIRSRKNVTAGFAERANLMAVGDISIKNACLQCTVKCNGRFALVTEKGRLVGGVTRARAGINVATLGNRGGIKTVVSFGQDYLIGDKIELEEKELEKIKAALGKAENSIAAAQKKGLQMELQEARKQKLIQMKHLEKRTERLFWLREKFEEHSQSEIRVRSNLYPGVILESHGRTHEITRESKNVTFVFSQESGRIEEKRAKTEE